jgi:hypothetical protein
MSGSLDTVAKELSRYKLHLMAILVVSWNNDGSEPKYDYKFIYANGDRLFCKYGNEINS